MSPGPAPPLSATSASSSGYDYYAELPPTPADTTGSVPSVKIVPGVGAGMDAIVGGGGSGGGSGDDEGRLGAGKVGNGGRDAIPLIEFDAKRVARRETGWDSMLEAVLLCWVHAVVDERRAAY